MRAVGLLLMILGGMGVVGLGIGSFTADEAPTVFELLTGVGFVLGMFVVGWLLYFKTGPRRGGAAS